MKKLNFIYLLLISVSYLSCNCRGNDCSGSVSQSVGVQLIDKDTGSPLNNSSYTIFMEGIPYRFVTKGTGKDSSIIHFNGGIFDKKGTFDGLFKINGTVVGRFLVALEASDCCGGYPESGKIEVKEGNMMAQATGRGSYSAISQNSEIFFILKL